MVAHKLAGTILITTLCLLASAGVGSAGTDSESDMSGNWHFELSPEIEGVPGDFFCIASLVHQGSTLSSLMSCTNFGLSQFTGPFDGSNGSFNLSGRLGTFDATIDGTVELSGSNAFSSLSGTWAAPEADFGEQVGLSGELVGYRSLFSRGLVRCPAIIVGPVTPAREVGSIDALLILQRSAGLSVSLPCLYLGDVNIDGEIDAIDANLVLQFVADLIDEFPPY